METANRCLVKNKTTGYDFIVYAHNIYCRNSDGTIRVATKEDTTSDESLFIKSSAEEIPITVVIYKHTKDDILRMRRGSVGTSKRIQIKKRFSFTPIKTPRPTSKRCKSVHQQKKNIRKDIWSVHQIEDDEVMKALQDDDSEEDLRKTADSRSLVNPDNDYSRDSDVVQAQVICRNDTPEEEEEEEERREIIQGLTFDQVEELDRNRKMIDGHEETERVSDAEKSIFQPETHDDRLVTRKYLEEELGALGKIIIERISEELHEKIPLPLQARPGTVRTAGTVPEVNQHGLEHDEQLIIEGIPINSHCYFLAANAKTMRKRANHIMRGYWTKEERDILVLRRNKRYADGRVVKSRELKNIKQLCLNLQSAKKLKYKARKHNIVTNLRDWLKDFLKNDRYRRLQMRYDDDDD